MTYLYSEQHMFFQWLVQSEVNTVTLTDDSEHARGLGGLGVTFVLSLIVKHRLVDDEDVLASLSDDLIFLSLPDFTSIFKPADLQDVEEEELDVEMSLRADLMKDTKPESSSL